MVDDPLHLRAKEEYLRLFREGRPMSLVEFAAHTREFLGQPISLFTIKQWKRDHGWAAQIRTSLNDTKEWKDINTYLSLWRKDLRSSTTDKDRATCAKAFLRLVRKIPAQIRWYAEEDIRDVRDFLYNYTLANWDSIIATHRSTMNGVWADLGSMIEQEVIIEDGVGVDVEEMILADREE